MSRESFTHKLVDFAGVILFVIVCSLVFSFVVDTSQDGTIQSDFQENA